MAEGFMIISQGENSRTEQITQSPTRHSPKGTT